MKTNRFKSCIHSHSQIIFGIVAVIALFWGVVSIPFSHPNPALPHISEAAAVKPLDSLRGEEAIQHLKKEGQYDSLAAALAAARYQVVWESSPLLRDPGGAHHAKNPAQGFSAYFTEAGVKLADFGRLKQGCKSCDTNPNWQMGLRLKGYGYGERIVALGRGELKAAQNRVEYAHAALTEWYENKAEGLEQGFTISVPPAADALGKPLRVVMQLSGELHGKLAKDGQAVIFRLRHHQPSLRYSGLKAWDARDRKLPTRMTLTDGELSLEVDDTDATYPIMIDPVFSQQAKLTAADGAVNDTFGASVAISGETAVTGVPGDDIGENPGQGSAYVFVRSGGMWTQQAKLMALDGSGGDGFGGAVAISEDTIVAGVTGDSIGGNSGQGSAYVFVRSGVTWTQQQKLTAADGGANDLFGTGVAISGNTVVVGATWADVGPNLLQGAAYVFVRSGTAWTQQQKLLASDGLPSDELGRSVAISGETIVVGAHSADMGPNAGQGKAYVFVRSGAIWTQQQQLSASDGQLGDVFGWSVGISGDTVVVGARGDNYSSPSFSHPDQGSVYVFVRSGATWTQQQKLLASDGDAEDNFGHAVAISGDTIVASAFKDDVGANADQGSAYLFSRSGTAWAQQAQLVAGDGAAGDRFGQDVALDGNTVVAGADLATVGGNTFQGAAYVFVVCTGLVEQQILNAGDGASGDGFGQAVSIDGDTAVIGAPNDDIGMNTGQGSVYVFVRNGATWTQQAKLTADDGEATDRLGYSVAVNGDTLAAGAISDDIAHIVGLMADQGSTYVFVRNGTTWTQQAKLTADDGLAGDQFGRAVAIEGNTAVVGAFRDDDGLNLNQGSAYVFERSGTTWTQQQKLTAGDGTQNDEYGWAVAICGDTIVVGSHFADVALQGAAYVYLRGMTNWSLQQKLTANDAAAGDSFGGAVAIEGNTVVIGAAGADIGMNTDQGAAYVFVRTAGVWSQQQKLTASDGGASHLSGASAGISGNRIVLGAILYDAPPAPNQGWAYVFDRNGLDWTERQKLVSSDGGPGDEFGFSAGISGDAILIGAYHNPVAGSDQGSAYIFGCGTCPPIALSPTELPYGRTGLFYTQTITASGGIEPYQFSLSAGNLPPGLNLSQAGILSGVPIAVGSYTFSVTATAANLCNTSRSFTIIVTPPCAAITISPANLELPAGTAGLPYNQQFTASGGTLPYTFAINAGMLPGGLSLSISGQLSGTPATFGSFNLRLRIFGFFNLRLRIFGSCVQSVQSSVSRCL